MQLKKTPRAASESGKDDGTCVLKVRENISREMQCAFYCNTSFENLSVYHIFQPHHIKTASIPLVKASVWNSTLEPQHHFHSHPPLLQSLISHLMKSSSPILPLSASFWVHVLLNLSHILANSWCDPCPDVLVDYVTI